MMRVIIRIYTYMKTAVFTSTIAPDLIKWVDLRARLEKKTRRAVLEDALRRYQQELTRRNLREGFMRAAQDPDMLECAEWGMDDYTNVIGK